MQYWLSCRAMPVLTSVWSGVVLSYVVTIPQVTPAPVAASGVSRWPSSSWATMQGLALTIPTYADLEAEIQNIREAVKSIPGIQDNTDTLKAWMPVLVGSIVLLAAAVYTKR